MDRHLQTVLLQECASYLHLANVDVSSGRNDDRQIAPSLVLILAL